MQPTPRKPQPLQAKAQENKTSGLGHRGVNWSGPRPDRLDGAHPHDPTTIIRQGVNLLGRPTKTTSTAANCSFIIARMVGFHLSQLKSPARTGSTGTESAITVDYIGPSRTNGYSITQKGRLCFLFPLSTR